jgi:hypothetical protein
MRPLPWQLRAPGFNGMQWCVLDADGALVCECDGHDEGQAEAEAIARAVNRAHAAKPWTEPNPEELKRQLTQLHDGLIRVLNGEEQTE